MSKARHSLSMGMIASGVVLVISDLYKAPVYPTLIIAALAAGLTALITYLIYK